MYWLLYGVARRDYGPFRSHIEVVRALWQLASAMRAYIKHDKKRKRQLEYYDKVMNGYNDK